MTIAGLINNITGSVRGLAVSLGLTQADRRPNFPDFPDSGIKYDDIQKKNWYQNPTVGTYAFAVQDYDKALKFGKAGGSDFLASVTSLFSNETSTDAFTDFELPISPQEITQTEGFAVGIRPTQGGTIVNHSGNKYKELVISGTTGVHPFKGITGADITQGNAIFQPDELKYRSGYEVFQHFRAWIKSYHQAKAEGLPGGVSSRKLRMVFKNYKDWEFLYVEPLKFTMRRNASRPLLYDYNISFKVIGHVTPPTADLSFLDRIDNALLVVKNTLQVARGIILKQQEIIRSVAGEVNGVLENLTTVALAIKAAKGIPITLSDVSRATNANYLSQLQAIKIASKLATSAKSASKDSKGFEAKGGDASNIPADPAAFADSLQTKLALAQLASGANSISQNSNAVTILLDALETAGGLGDLISTEDYPPAAQLQIRKQLEAAASVSARQLEKAKTEIQSLYDIYSDAIGFGDTTYNSIRGFVPTTAPMDASTITDDQFEVLYGFQQAILGLDGLLSSDDLFDQNSKKFNQADSQSGANSVGQGVFPALPQGSGFKEIVVPAGATLEDIALVEFGDTSRWTQIADMNGLKPPYIIDAASDGSITVRGEVRSSGFSNPAQITDLVPGYQFIVTEIPIPAGAWLGKANAIAEFLGGDPTDSATWVFRAPNDDQAIRVLDINEVFVFDGISWNATSVEEHVYDGVVKAGDIIRVPSASSVSKGAKVRGRRDNPVTFGLSESEKAFCVDLKLTEDGDLDLLPSGDLNVSKGAANGSQAIILKLLYEKGSLKKFPNIGTNLGLGRKVPDVGTIRTQVYSSLIQDERIRDVRDINLIQVNNSITLTFTVYFRSIQEPVQIEIPI